MNYFGVDIGGTFTDVVVFDDETGRISDGKVESTPPNFALGFENALRSQGINLKQTARGLHGTTVCTNAVIQRKGAPTIGIFTKGFRDVIEIGTGERFTGGLLDPKFQKAKPLIPRSHSLEITERTSYKGESLCFPEEKDLLGIANIIRAQGASAVAVCFLHSYANPDHEKFVVNFLQKELPDVFICSSADVLPVAGEYHRFVVTTFNAYIGPVMHKYVHSLNSWLRKGGFSGDLLIMASNGGAISADQACRYPVATLLSGPTAGVSASIFVGSHIGIDDLITYDMGGTSTDACLIKHGIASVSEDQVLHGLPIRWPQVEIISIGAGGGSIAWCDRYGEFGVGPQSAAAIPGPACYGLGGREPTVTDASLILNRLGTSTRLAGFKTLKLELAQDAVGILASKLGYKDLNYTAEGILRIVESNMAGAIREISIERGEDPRRFCLIAFGGAGPMFGCAVAQEVGMCQIIVPKVPGSFSALGLIVSDLKHDIIRTYRNPLKDTDISEVTTLLHKMGAQGRSILLSEGVSDAGMQLTYSLGMRYLGQSREVIIPVSPDNMEREALEKAFRKRYFEEWAYNPDVEDIELVNGRVIAIGKIPKLTFPPLENHNKHLEQAHRGYRSVYLDGKFIRTPVYDREILPAEAVLKGPAIIEEVGSTTVMRPDWEGRVDDIGNIILSLR